LVNHVDVGGFFKDTILCCIDRIAWASVFFHVEIQ